MFQILALYLDFEGAKNIHVDNHTIKLQKCPFTPLTKCLEVRLSQKGLSPNTYHWIKMSIECSKAVQGFSSKIPHCWGWFSCLLDLERTIGSGVLALYPTPYITWFLVSPREIPPKDSQQFSISNQDNQILVIAFPGYISPFMGIF